MRIRSRFVDDDGERKTEDFIEKGDEGVKAIELRWVKPFWELLLDALECGDDVEIEIKRIPNKNSFVV